MAKAYLDFKEANCKNCYKCLHDCPVKAITVLGDQARIKDELCVLCGHCANVCRFNAKVVAPSIAAVNELLKSGKKVIVSLAPAFVSSFSTDFGEVKSALKKLGFYDVEETARGAKSVTAEYKKLLDSGKYVNLIASACPAIVRLIQIYHPQALKYLAPVLSPMLAHAKLIKRYNPDCAIVFVGPCIAKKREADESGMIDEVLTFEELTVMLKEAGLTLKDNGIPQKENCIAQKDNCIAQKEENAISTEKGKEKNQTANESAAIFNKAQFYPINRGIIKSFSKFSDGYEYISVDGMERAREVLDNIDTLSGMFIEMHACEFSCINGPCALNKNKGGFIKATEKVRSYVSLNREKALEYAGLNSAGLNSAGGNIDLLSKSGKSVEDILNSEEEEGDFTAIYPIIEDTRAKVAEEEIKIVLQSTGKFTADDELNCGACGYATCRDKAEAVIRGMAEKEMCVPYMRARAEGLSYDIIQNSPNGILAVNENFEITEINDSAAKLLGAAKSAATGELLEKFFNPTDFYLCYLQNEKIDRKKIHIEKTNSWVELTVKKVTDQNMMFCIMKDITADIDYAKKLSKLKSDTVLTTNDVIEKQMRVVQEIASLLGETAAETKIALIKLKNAIAQDN